MSFLDDVGKFFEGGWNDLKGAVSHAWTVVKTLWTFCGSIFNHVTEAWGDFWHGIVAVGQTIEKLAVSSYTAIKWLIDSAIPKAVAYVFATLLRWGKVAIHTAVHAAEVAGQTLIRSVERWVTGLWRDLKALIGDAARLAKNAWDFIERAGKWTYQLVSKPEALVAWILPHLILPLAKVLIRSSGPVIRWLFANIRVNALDFAHLVEDVLTKVV